MVGTIVSVLRYALTALRYGQRDCSILQVVGLGSSARPQSVKGNKICVNSFVELFVRISVFAARTVGREKQETVREDSILHVALKLSLARAYPKE